MHKRLVHFFELVLSRNRSNDELERLLRRPNTDPWASMKRTTLGNLYHDCRRLFEKTDCKWPSKSILLLE